MNDEDFEGTLVLERMNEVGKLGEFWDAIDCDDFKKAMSLMKNAQIDAETISMVLKKMSEGT